VTGPERQPGEGDLSFMLREYAYQAWQEGHDASCPIVRGDCYLHPNPHRMNVAWTPKN
jgi:hypothetical protein